MFRSKPNNCNEPCETLVDLDGDGSEDCNVETDRNHEQRR
jgi:hypothetical protein